METRCRPWVVILLLCVTTVRAWAQTPAPPGLDLGQAVTVGQWVVISDDHGRDTRGVVRAVDAGSLKVGNRVFSAQNIVVIKRTDDLGNGTAAGALLGVGATAAAFGRCSRYQFSEERGLCQAAALVYVGLFGIPLGAYLGRAIDRAIGDVEVYRRPARSTSTSIQPWWRPHAGGVAATVSW